MHHYFKVNSHRFQSSIIAQDITSQTKAYSKLWAKSKTETEDGNFVND